MKKFLLMSAVIFAGANLMTAADEPVVMTVNGVDVLKSEFEYLFHKNNLQQLNPQSIDDYVEMFKIYKLKVEDAKSLGIDTTEAFQKEIAQYRRELAAPFIADSVYIKEMINNAYNRSQEEVEVSVIKIPKARNPIETVSARQKADSVRNMLVKGADFAELAKTYSSDMAADKGGYHGFMGYGRLPFAFEEALYTLQPGEISEIIDLNDGYYIIRTGKRRPSRGKVETAHILKMFPQGANEEQKHKAKEAIDSIYQLATESPFVFGNVAKKYSDDKISARQEGKLPVFGAGEMVPELEEVAFSLEDGAVSQPFETAYGWHIVKKFRSVNPPNEAEVAEEIHKKLSNPQDSRYRIMRDRELNNLVAKHRGELVDSAVEELKRSIPQEGIDSLYLANWTTMPLSGTVVGRVGNKNLTAGEVLSPLKKVQNIPADQAVALIDQGVNRMLGLKALEVEEEELYVTVPEYRNLLDEYVDGSLLYEVSLQKVWDRAAKDNEGLEDFYKKNARKYKWDKPHAKGILVQAQNDSIGNLVKSRLEDMKNDPSITLDKVRKEFSGKAVIEKVVASEGVNPMIDNLMFGGPVTKPKVTAYTVYFIFDGQLVDQPTELVDVRGEVLTDYQEELEREWVKELTARYPVKLNKKELKKIK